DIRDEEQAAVFRLVAHAAPARMIAVLLAAPGVAADSLNVAIRIRTDPDIGPGRRHRQRLDAPQDRAVADEMAGGVAIGEAGPGATPRDARRGVADITQAG